MKILPKLSAIISVMAFLFSCKSPVTGEGPIVSKSITREEFSEVSFCIPGNLKVVRADSFNCIITAQQNIIDAIKVETKGDELEITSKYSLKTVQPVSIVVSLPVLEFAEVMGSGNIEFVNPVKGDKIKLYIDGSGSINARVDMDEVKSRLNGSGSIILSGSCETSTCEINGSGNLEAFDLKADNVDITIKGSGDADVTASEKMKADIRGSGNINYKGQPHVVSEIVGSGKINKK